MWRHSRSILSQTVQSQVAVILIPFQNTAPLQEASHPLADVVEQLMGLCDRRERSAVKAQVASIVLYVDAIFIK